MNPDRGPSVALPLSVSNRSCRAMILGSSALPSSSSCLVSICSPCPVLRDGWLSPLVLCLARCQSTVVRFLAGLASGPWPLPLVTPRCLAIGYDE